MSNLFDVISFSKKIKRENFGQNKDNLINYLNKDYGYSRESAIEVVQKAVTENMLNIVLFNGKDSYRIVDNVGNTILVPNTQQNEPESIEAIPELDESNIEKTLVDTPILFQILERRLEEISRSIENKFLSIEHRVTSARDFNINKKGNNTSYSGFCLDLLKKSGG